MYSVWTSLNQSNCTEKILDNYKCPLGAIDGPKLSQKNFKHSSQNSPKYIIWTLNIFLKIDDVGLNLYQNVQKLQVYIPKRTFYSKKQRKIVISKKAYFSTEALSKLFYNIEFSVFLSLVKLSLVNLFKLW